MAATSTPYGAQIVSDQSGTVRPVRMPLGIASGYAANIFKFQPIKLVNGLIQACTNPGGTPDPIFGFFDGVEFTPVGGRPAVSPFWPAGTVYDSTYQMFVYFTPAWIPNFRVRIQADGSVAQALMGSQFNFTNLAAGSTSTGLSQCTVGAAGVVSGSQGQLALTEFDTAVGDPFAGGDAFTDLICTVAYPQVGFGAQKSIG
jgi:hypothetical protein